MTDYTDFLRQKIKMANFKGFSVEPGNVHQVHYLQSAEKQVSMPSLFDALEAEVA